MDNSKMDEKGVMYVIENGDITQYSIFTHSGHYRGGKIYFADKVVRILSGKTELTTFVNEKDVKRIFTPEDGEIIIPSGTPNLFYFPLETLMIEWFPTGTKIEEYDRYTQMKK